MAAGSPSDVSLSSESERKQRKYTKTNNKDGTADPLLLDAKIQSNKEASQLGYRKLEQSKASSSSSSSSAITLKMGTLEDLKRMHPKAFDKKTPRLAPLAGTAEREQTQFQPPLVESLLKRYSRITPVTLVKAPIGSAVVAATGGSSSSSSTVEIIKDAKEKQIIIETNRTDPPLFTATHLQKLLHEGGEWTDSVTGESFNVPLCCNDCCDCIVYSMKLSLCNGFPQGCVPKMMAMLTPEEYQRVLVDKRPLHNLKRQCILCECFAVQDFVLNVRNHARDLHLAEGLYIQHFRVKPDGPDGLKRAYVIFPDANHPCGLTDAFPQLCDSRTLVGRMTPDKRMYFDMSPMIWRNPLERTLMIPDPLPSQPTHKRTRDGDHENDGGEEEEEEDEKTKQPADDFRSSSSSSSSAVSVSNPAPAPVPTPKSGRKVTILNSYDLTEPLPPPTTTTAAEAATEAAVVVIKNEQKEEEMQNFYKPSKSPVLSEKTTEEEEEQNGKEEDKELRAVLNYYRSAIRTRERKQKKQATRRTDRETILRSGFEQAAAVSDPILLHDRMKSCCHVEHLLGMIHALTQLYNNRKEELQPLLEPLIIIGTHDILADYLQRLVPLDVLREWTNKATDGRYKRTYIQCLRFSELSALLTKKEGEENDSTQARRARQIPDDAVQAMLQAMSIAKSAILDPTLPYGGLFASLIRSVTLHRVMEWVSDTTILKCAERVATRDFLHIFRLTLLEELRQTVLSTVKRMQQAAAAKQTEHDAQLFADVYEYLRYIHYHTKCLMDAYWFVVYRFLHKMKGEGQEEKEDEVSVKQYEARADVIDLHWETVDVVNERTLYVLTDCIERSIYMDDPHGKKVALIHFLMKLRPRRSQSRMLRKVIEPCLGFDPFYSKIITQMVMCSLLGNYSHFDLEEWTSETDNLSFSFRCFLYWNWVQLKESPTSTATTTNPSMLFFGWLYSTLPRLVFHAGLQSVAVQTRGLPHLYRLCESSYRFETLHNGSDAIVRDIRQLLMSHQHVLLRKDQFKKTMPTELTEPLKYKIASISNASKKLLLSVSVFPRRYRTFFHGVRSCLKGMPVKSPSASSLPSSFIHHAEDDDDNDCEEAEEEWSDSNSSGSDDESGTSDAEDHQTTTAPPPQPPPQQQQQQFIFGVSESHFKAMEQLVGCLDACDPYPERCLLEAMEAMGAPKTARMEVKRSMYLFDIGKKIETPIRRLYARYPHSYALLQLFATLLKRRQVLLTVDLPTSITRHQISALSKRFSLKNNNNNMMVQNGIELLFCDICQGVRSHVREPLGKEHVFGKDSGFVNLLVDMDPLLSRPQPLCNGVETFGLHRCGERPLIRIPLIGRHVLFNSNTIISICAYPGCGVPSVIIPNRSAYSERYGFACSDCTACLRLYSQMRAVVGNTKSLFIDPHSVFYNDPPRKPGDYHSEFNKPFYRNRPTPFEPFGLTRSFGIYLPTNNNNEENDEEEEEDREGYEYRIEPGYDEVMHFEYKPPPQLNIESSSSSSSSTSVTTSLSAVSMMPSTGSKEFCLTNEQKQNNSSSSSHRKTSPSTATTSTSTSTTTTTPTMMSNNNNNNNATESRLYTGRQIICDVCRAIILHFKSFRLYGCALSICKKHHTDSIDRECERNPLTKQTSDTCSSDSQCHCANLKTTCTGRWNVASIAAIIQRMDNKDFRQMRATMDYIRIRKARGLPRGRPKTRKIRK